MSSSSESHGTNDLNAAGHEGVTIERTVYVPSAEMSVSTTIKAAVQDMESMLSGGWDATTEAHFILAIEALRTAKPAEWQGMEDWIRDTAMDVMLATEVEEACRILAAALPSAPTQDISHDK